MSRVRRIHLVARDNGVGLSRDMALLTDALRAGGFDLTVTAIGHGAIGKALRRARVRAGLAWRGWRAGSAAARFDVNLMDERIWPEYLPLARRNVLLPHPEWFKPGYAANLASIDRVFAKTRHAVPLFEALGCRTVFVGFTSVDRRLADVPREATFLHLGGRSRNKGSQALLDAWLRRPDWPPLALVQRAELERPARLPPNVRVVDRYLDDGELQAMQNRAWFHLCPSETEGFGHHLVEAMSVGAVVLATDAPPMNEMVTPSRGVPVPFVRTGRQSLATTYFVDADAVAGGIERMLALTDGGRRALGAAARAWWEDNDRAFRKRLCEEVAALADE